MGRRDGIVGMVGRVALVAGLALTSCGGGGGRDGDDRLRSGEPPAASAGEPGEWVAVPDSPLGPRAGAVAVWTGEEVLVVGGRTVPGCPPNASCAEAEPVELDGAAYDPDAGTWRTITAAPAPVDVGAVVVDGDAWFPSRAGDGSGGGIGGPMSVLRHDVDRDRWDELTVPAPGGAWYALAAADGRLVLYSTTHEGRVTPDLVYDVGAGTWDELPPAPLSPAFDRTIVGAGDRLVLFDHELVPQPGSEAPSVTRAATYDLATGTWDRLPDSDILRTSPWFVSGDTLVNPALGGADGGEVGNWGRTVPYGGILDLGTSPATWRPFPAPPSADATGVGGVVGRDTALYTGLVGPVLDLDTGEWVDLPRLPEAPGESPERRANRTIVAAGRDLFAFGGVVWPVDRAEGAVLADAWIWSPPTD